MQGRCRGDRERVWELAVRVLKLLYLPYISPASPLLSPLLSPCISQVRVLKLHWDPRTQTSDHFALGTTKIFLTPPLTPTPNPYPTPT